MNAIRYLGNYKVDSTSNGSNPRSHLSSNIAGTGTKMGFPGVFIAHFKTIIFTSVIPVLIKLTPQVPLPRSKLRSLTASHFLYKFTYKNYNSNHGNDKK